ncbi:MAG TPA: ABC transporter permease, partial [Blastocatellia bacterium]|nr:ABC transporter permease [Blastocatellia bacterium]
MRLLRLRFTNIARLLSLSIFRRPRVDDELDEELLYHIERQVEANVAAGMSQRQALNAALKSFLGFQQRKEECRDMRHLNVIDNVLRDLRFSVRQLLRNPVFTATAVLVLGLGLASAVAIFAFVDAALFKPLPYRDTSRLVGVYEQHPGCERCNLSYLDFVDWKKQNSAFTSLEAYKNSGFILTVADGAAAARGARVSDGFFRTLGVTPALGRDFYAGEDQPGAARTVLLSNAAWKERYGGKSDAIGRTVIIDSEPYTIIGVLPADFHFAPVGPVEFWATLDSKGGCESRRSCHNLYGVARLKDGITIQQALADTTAIAQRLKVLYPDSNDGGANVAPLSEVIVGQIRPILLTLLGGAGLLLLIACVNVASLLLVRSESRSRELAVRSALGASRGRLLAQFVTEGLLLVSIACVGGIACSWWIMRLLSRLIPDFMMAGLP